MRLFIQGERNIVNGMISRRLASCFFPMSDHPFAVALRSLWPSHGGWQHHRVCPCRACQESLGATRGPARRDHCTPRNLSCTNARPCIRPSHADSSLPRSPGCVNNHRHPHMPRLPCYLLRAPIRKGRPLSTHPSKRSPSRAWRAACGMV